MLLLFLKLMEVFFQTIVFFPFLYLVLLFFLFFFKGWSVKLTTRVYDYFSLPVQSATHFAVSVAESVQERCLSYLATLFGYGFVSAFYRVYWRIVDFKIYTINSFEVILIIYLIKQLYIDYSLDITERSRHHLYESLDLMRILRT